MYLFWRCMVNKAWRLVLTTTKMLEKVLSCRRWTYICMEIDLDLYFPQAEEGAVGDHPSFSGFPAPTSCPVTRLSAWPHPLWGRGGTREFRQQRDHEEVKVFWESAHPREESDLWWGNSSRIMHSIIFSISNITSGGDHGRGGQPSSGVCVCIYVCMLSLPLLLYFLTTQPIVSKALRGASLIHSFPQCAVFSCIRCSFNWCPKAAETRTHCCLEERLICRSPIGRFSEAGLLEWMRFVIFRTRSRERLQHTSRPISE